MSELCFGCMTFGTKWVQVGITTQKDADAIIAKCLDAGINFFDTADVYSAGESEDILGTALGARRKDALIATKVRGRMSDAVNELGISRHHILESCDASLKRLKTEHIDLYQFHGWDRLTPLDESLKAMDDLVRWGKVRYIGVSNFAGWHLMKALAISDARGWERFVTLQTQYSLVVRQIEYELVPLCIDQGLGILPWSPLAGGFLTGKYRKGQPRPAGARRSDVSAQSPVRFKEEDAWPVIDALDEIAKAHKASISQAALNWLLAKPVVSSVIIGARDIKQLEDNLATENWSLTPEEVAKLDEVSAPAKVYPYAMIEMFNANR
ncbi:MAG: aldo/keto reductase [bacterium]